MDDYITAERRGRDSLRRFLLDLDAKEANAIEDLRHNGPRPADAEWRAARAEHAKRQALGSLPSALVVSNRAHPRGKIRNWLDTP
jgi:hypothetical protein